jgi:uncharacterized protein YyaL (SSP411 family)
MNAHFVPIKVDREERPDVDAGTWKLFKSWPVAADGLWT